MPRVLIDPTDTVLAVPAGADRLHRHGADEFCRLFACVTGVAPRVCTLSPGAPPPRPSEDA